MLNQVQKNPQHLFLPDSLFIFARTLSNMHVRATLLRKAHQANAERAKMGGLSRQKETFLIQARKALSLPIHPGRQKSESLKKRRMAHPQNVERLSL